MSREANNAKKAKQTSSLPTANVYLGCGLDAVEHSLLWTSLIAEFIQHDPQTGSRFCLTSAEESAVLRAVCTQPRLGVAACMLLFLLINLVLNCLKEVSYCEACRPQPEAV